MGKYILLTVFAIALGISVFSHQGREIDLDTSQSQAERQEKVLAREIANSAFEMGLSELRRDFENWRKDLDDVAHEGGSYDISATGPSAGPVSLTAVGRYGGVAYEVTGRSTKDTTVSSLINAITALTPITFDVSGGGCNGGPCISGIDVGGGDDRHGVTLPTGEDPDAVCGEFDGKIEGTGGGCDVVTRTSESDDWTETRVDALESEIQAAQDAGNGAITVCDGCSVGNLADTSGILYVTGELRYNGAEQWDGLIFVSDGGSVRINGGGDVRNINGGLILSDSTSFNNDEEFDMNGGNSVQYNSEALRPFFSVLPSLKSTTVNITDRTGRFLNNSE